MYLQPLYEKYAYFCHGESEGISDRIFKDDICLSSGSICMKMNSSEL